MLRGRRLHVEMAMYLQVKLRPYLLQNNLTRGTEYFIVHLRHTINDSLIRVAHSTQVHILYIHIYILSQLDKKLSRCRVSSIDSAERGGGGGERKKREIEFDRLWLLEELLQ